MAKDHKVNEYLPNSKMDYAIGEMKFSRMSWMIY